AAAGAVHAVDLEAGIGAQGEGGGVAIGHGLRGIRRNAARRRADARGDGVGDDDGRNAVVCRLVLDQQVIHVERIVGGLATAGDLADRQVGDVKACSAVSARVGVDLTVVHAHLQGTVDAIHDDLEVEVGIDR